MVMAGDVFDALGLDRLYFVPASIPPHKTDRVITPPHIRLEMVRETVVHDSRIEVSTAELEREGPSYTVDTVQEIQDGLPDAELYVIFGADQFAALGSWKEPERIASMARLVVMAREGLDPEDLDPGVDVEYVRVPVSRIDISSTEIRERVRKGVSIEGLVASGVHSVIERESLYL
jgi:nicotinate-nucleotide adenylyltransferase